MNNELQILWPETDRRGGEEENNQVKKERMRMASYKPNDDLTY